MPTENIKIIYDISAMPDGIALDQLYNIVEASGILVWDSSKGEQPTVLTDRDIKIMDLKFLSKKEIEEKFSNFME